MLITDKNEYQSKIKRIIITEEEIRKETKKIAEVINKEYEGKPLILVCLLKGSFIFFSDLAKEITIPCEIGFMTAKSYYESTESSGNVKILHDLDIDINNYHVLIVEDIVDTGRTLYALTDLLKKRNPLSIKVLTLLDKPDRRVVDLKVDYSLFTIPDLFVIGYGLDYGEYYRNLPYVAEYNADADGAE